MHPFRYERAADASAAITRLSQEPSAQFIAGGTSQVDLMKEDVHRPTRLVDISRLPLGGITELPGGGVRIGAGVTNSQAAYHQIVRERYPALAESILAGASTQIRNMASMAGNILQRTRCPYFRDTAQDCNKREPGTGCSALAGYNRMHAIFGASTACIATHPSDMAVALAAHEATIVVQTASGERRIAFDDFHRLPGDAPQNDTNLRHGELIVAFELPAFRGNSHYLKVRDRASYAYALVSACVALSMDKSNISRAVIALGSVAHKPWRAFDAEKLLVGKQPSADLFRQAAQQAFAGAKTYEMNKYKVPLGRSTLTRALMETSGLTPLQGTKGTALASSAGGIAGDMPTA